jgi:hypothetical protein
MRFFLFEIGYLKLEIAIGTIKKLPLHNGADLPSPNHGAISIQPRLTLSE